MEGADGLAGESDAGGPAGWRRITGLLGADMLNRSPTTSLSMRDRRSSSIRLTSSSNLSRWLRFFASSKKYVAVT